MTNTKFGVLVVEDMDRIAKQLATYICGNRWLDHAGTAASEREAIDMARRLRPDLVLLDFGLSTPAGGFDVWRALRELDTVPDVIAVTAAGDMATVEKARRCGAFGYVVKPYTRATIEAQLADYASFMRWVTSVPSSAGQSVINRIFYRRLRSAPLPPGLLLETLDSVLRLLLAAGRPLRASEVGDEVGVQRSTANKYLTHLCDQGIAERVPDHGGHIGHPPYLYTLASVWKLPPDQE
jgi:response regulator of citrate/malate metabolism